MGHLAGNPSNEADAECNKRLGLAALCLLAGPACTGGALGAPVEATAGRRERERWLRRVGVECRGNGVEVILLKDR